MLNKADIAIARTIGIDTGKNTLRPLLCPVPRADFYAARS
jgi:hypothetical protein